MRHRIETEPKLIYYMEVRGQVYLNLRNRIRNRVTNRHKMTKYIAMIAKHNSH